jgi:hypothetical protein
MTFKFLPLFAAILACALWPQGVVLCMGDEGHVEVELEGTGCCPSETDEECVDCADFTAPDQQSAPPVVVLATPTAGSFGLLPDAGPADRTEDTTPFLPPRDRALEGVKLLV